MKTATKTMIALAALTASLGAMAPMADAQNWRGNTVHQEMRVDDVQSRINSLQGRLNDGWRSRQLNRREYSRLNSRLNRIAWESRRANRSGRGLDRNEMLRLNSQLDNLSRVTFFQKHDDDRRGGGRDNDHRDGGRR